MTDLIRYAHHRGIATLTLDSPANRNALSAALVAELRDALDRCGKDDTVRAVVLTHTGNTFCAGADLRDPPDPQALVDLLRLLLELPKPVVARPDVSGDAGELTRLSSRLFASADAREGMTAFLERREPGWVL
ncbi:enoyl-CoA hydratase-related protein [Streptomyces scabiei]|uniref:enoyl-CoA hydratase-related protein n=1 Tax=Streptomyces scabiei TaxID=1930 RepID=UPI000A3AAB3E|nr:enoyl-CoA hydratase-related protein [Streptomyces scabiei]